MWVYMCKGYSSKIIQEDRNTNLFFSLEGGSRSTELICFRKKNSIGGGGGLEVSGIPPLLEQP